MTIGSVFLSCGLVLACAPMGEPRPPAVGEAVACSVAGLEAFAACQRSGEPSPACALATARALEICTAPRS